MLFFLVMICHVSGADQEPAFILSGNFEDVFAGKHNIGGIFTVSAFESNALVDMTFENGFRQVVGTDGHDSFTYIPFTGDSNIIKNANGQAVISYGRFPIDAHEFQQFLWLTCVHDPELITNLHAYRFSFYAKYHTNDVILQVVTNTAPPNLITSIKWFAPNYLVTGTNHYTLAMYPNGYLMAEISTTKTKTNGSEVVPSEVTFNQYNPAPLNPSDLQKDVKGHYNLPPRNQTDVVPVEFALISISNVQMNQPLPSYIPEILDKTARINDKRIPEMEVAQVVSSGKWWAARELYKSREASVKPHRKIILAIMLIIFISPIFLLIKLWKTKKKPNKNK
jgi:hypothetical protein